MTTQGIIADIIADGERRALVRAFGDVRTPVEVRIDVAKFLVEKMNDESSAFEVAADFLKAVVVAGGEGVR